MIVSGMDLLSVSQRELSCACSLGFIRKFTVLDRVSGSPRRRDRPPLPVSGALGMMGVDWGMIMSIGRGVKANKASESEGFTDSAVAGALRANGSGGMGRSLIPISYPWLQLV